MILMLTFKGAYCTVAFVSHMEEIKVIEAVLVF